MKYIMFETAEGQRLPIIFPDVLVHAEVAEWMQRMLIRTQRKYATPISAGFVGLGLDITVEGMSESLGDLPCGQHDAAVIACGEQAAFMPVQMIQRIFDQAKDRRDGQADT